MSQDVYAKITARIVSALREGVVPWHQPWSAAQLHGYQGAPISISDLPRLLAEQPAPVR